MKPKWVDGITIYFMFFLVLCWPVSEHLLDLHERFQNDLRIHLNMDKFYISQIQSGYSQKSFTTFKVSLITDEEQFGVIRLYEKWNSNCQIHLELRCCPEQILFYVGYSAVKFFFFNVTFCYQLGENYSRSKQPLN